MTHFKPRSERENVLYLKRHKVSNYCVNCGMPYKFHNVGKCPQGEVGRKNEEAEFQRDFQKSTEWLDK